MENISVAQVNGVNIIKIVGKAVMQISLSVEKLLIESKKTPILDLSETSYIDSTFLGLIAKYSLIFKKKNNEFLSIVRPTKSVLDNLEKTGILKFVLIIDKTIQINAKEVEATKISNEELKKHILELHEILMNLNEENKKIFSNVVELMKKGLDK